MEQWSVTENVSIRVGLVCFKLEIPKEAHLQLPKFY